MVWGDHPERSEGRQPQARKGAWGKGRSPLPRFITAEIRRAYPVGGNQVQKRTFDCVLRSDPGISGHSRLALTCLLVQSEKWARFVMARQIHRGLP